MIGQLNDTCEWCRQISKNKYGEVTYSTPYTLRCTKGHVLRYIGTTHGVERVNEQYYILHSGGVQDGDTIDGYTVAVSEEKDVTGAIAYYKAVVLNG